MAALEFEFRFESTDPIESTTFITNAKELFRKWIDAKEFQASVNSGLQVVEDLNIQVIDTTDDLAAFEVVDGWAEPCLKYKPKT